MGELILIGMALALGSLLGWVAFFRTLSFGERMRALEGEIAGLKKALAAAQGLNENVEEVKHSQASEDVSACADGLNQPASELAHAPGDEATAPPPWRLEHEPEAASERPSVRPDHGDRTKTFTNNWLVWVGGAALVLGGGFLVKSAIDAGLFGPWARVIATVLIGAAMTFAGEYSRVANVAGDSEPQEDGSDSRSAGPAVLSGAGGATIYGAIFAAFGVFHLIGPFVAIALLALTSGGVLWLSTVHRSPAMAGLSLVGAYVSPLIIAGEISGVGVLPMYVFAVSAAGIFVSSRLRWSAIGWIALAGGLAWPLAMIFGNAGSVDGLAIYLPAFLALTVATAAPAGRHRSDDGMRQFYVACVGSVAAALALTFAFASLPLLSFMWAAFVAVALFAAWRGPALTWAPIVLLVSVFLSILGAVPGATMYGALLSALLALLFAAGGVSLVLTAPRKTAPAILAAFGPALILIAQYWIRTGGAPHLSWGAAAMALSATNIGLLAGLRGASGKLESFPGASAAFVLGASFCSAVAVAAAFDQLMLSVALALQAPVLAGLWLRFRLEPLKVAALAIAMLSSARLLLLPEVLDYEFGAAPLLNLLAPGYLLPSLGFWLAARWFDDSGAQSGSRVVQALEAGAIALFAAFITLELRHLFNNGDIGAGHLSLFEASLQIINWLSISVFLRVRFGDQLTFVRRAAEIVLLALSASVAFAVLLFSANPWWGWRAEPVIGLPVFNDLLITYLAPTIGFGASAYAARKQGLILQARLSGLFAALMGYVWMALVARHIFHGADLSAGAVLSGESWVYSFITVIYGAAFVIASAIRGSAVLRIAGFAALILAIVKVFLIDMAGLDGVLRATAFLGLGAALIGVAMAYQRLTQAAQKRHIEAA